VAHFDPREARQTHNPAAAGSRVQIPPSEAQFSRALDSQTRLGIMAPDSKLAELPAWIAHHLTEDLSVDGLAKAVGMTRRTFLRR
jgi:transcriptional regulator GlxA family with amidase domain